MFLMGQLEEHLEPDAVSVAMNLIQPLSNDGWKREMKLTTTLTVLFGLMCG